MKRHATSFAGISRAIIAGFCIAAPLVPQIGGLVTYAATYTVQATPTMVTVQPGFSSIADNYVASPNNSLSVVLPNAVEDTQVYKWNGAVQGYDTYTKQFGVWEPNDTTLSPGEGAFISSPVAQTFTFSGQVGPAPARPRLPTGFYLVSCRTPASCTFDEMMGFPPMIGDRVIKYDTNSPTGPTPSSTHQYTAAGWSPSAPVLAVAKAAFVQLVGQAPPTITQQPEDQIVNLGQAAAFMVVASGAPSLSYQWRRNGATIAGATGSTHTIASASAANAGNYDVVVTNPGGSTTSAVARLIIVGPAPSITGVSPLTGTSGDIITITGNNFGSNSDNICSMVMGSTPVTMRVLSASNTRITARLGPVAPNAQPGPIMLSLGLGSTKSFSPIFSNNIVVQENWTWRSSAASAGGNITFTPTYTPPEPPQRWFYSTLTNGVLCLYLSGNWGTNARVYIDSHLKAGGTWYDMQPRTFLVGSGTTLQCATLIKDIIVCDAQQNLGVLLPADVEDLGGGVVKVTVRAPNNRPIDMGWIVVCTSPPRVPVITSVSPLSGVSGDIITITGSGFGSDPDNLCAGVMGNPPVAMRVLSATDTRITARLGAVPPNATPGRIGVMVGQGNTALFTPVLSGITVLNNWSWQSREGSGLSTANFTPVFVPPDLNQQWFHAVYNPGNGQLVIDLSGDWGSNARIWVELHILSGGVWYDLQTCDIFAGSGTTLDCANKLKDLIVCGLQQGQGVLVPATVTDLGGGVVRVTLHGVNDQFITNGSLSVCTVPPLVPVITSVSPAQGVTGDIITITGSGFGNNPNNVCVMAVSAVGAVPWDPLRLLSATDTRLTVRLGTIPPPQPGMPPPVIAVQLGEGNAGPFVPIFPSIKGGDDTWVWTSRETPTVSNIPFQTTHTPPGPGQQYFYGQVTNGVMCAYIRGNWVTNARVMVELHFNAGDTHYDMQERTVTFANGGTAFECAQLIKDLIVCSFSQRAGVLLPADVEQIGADLVKVTIRSPNGAPITSGMLTICCLAPRVPVITSVSPSDGVATGDIITITGSGFGNNPNNICLMAVAPLVPPKPWDPLRVLSATDTRITARLGSVPPPMPGMPGPPVLMLQMGEGNAGPITPIFPSIMGADDTWVWTSREPAVTAPGTFQTVYTPPNPGQQYFYGQVTNGVMCVYISGNWVTNARVSVEMHFNAGGTHYDMQERTAVFANGGTALECAQFIKDLIVCAFGQRGGVLLPADVEPVGPNLVKVTVRSPNSQPITSGMLTICCMAPRVPVITSVSPTQGVTGDIITITGSGFGNNPNNVCVMAVGATAGAPPWDPFRVLMATDTRLTARLGTVPPPMGNMPPPLIAVHLGDGNAGPITPIFPSIKGGEDTWVWTSRETPTVSTIPFQTTHTPPGPGQQYFYGQITNGVICVYIQGNWVTNARVTVELHFNAGGTHYDMQERTVTFANGGTALECAQLIKDLIVCSLSQRAGVLVPADVEQIGAGLVKVTLRSPNGQRITSGLLTICCLPPCDTIRPVVLSVDPDCLTNNRVVVTFSEPMSPAPANNAANYFLINLSGGPAATVLAAMLSADGLSVRLQTTPLQCDNLYALVISTNLTDLCGNPLPQTIDGYWFRCPCPSPPKVAKWSQVPGYLVFTNAGQNPNMHGGDRPSDFDWTTLTQSGTNLVPPNWVIADDFRSDGRPILCVRWWGSYMPGFEPQSATVPPFEDGFVLSFFTDRPVAANTPFSRPERLLATYVAPIAAVVRTPTSYIGWDSNRIWQYEVDLSDTCLDHALHGIARPSAFLERSNSIYWLAINAEVGHRIVPVTNSAGGIIDWVQTQTNKRATNHFWGWHTSPTQRLDLSVMGHIIMQGTNWIYPNALWQTNQLFHMEVDQAFQLLTAPIACPPAPTLTITRAAASASLVISWSGTGFILQCTPELSDPVWTSPWSDVATTSPVTVPNVPGQNRFYRLICP